jgi:hypothetical protein
MMRNIFFIFLFPLFISSVFSQEVISDLLLNPQLIEKNKNDASYKTYTNKYYYIIDTLSLPFIDDFSIDKTKAYGIDSSQFLGNTVYYSYSVDESFDVDSLSYMLDTTYRFFWNTVTDTVDSILNSSIQIIFFNNEINPFFPNDTLTVWPTYWTYILDTLGSLSDSVEVTADSTIYLASDTLTIIKEDNSLWIDNDAFINDNFPVNPVTVGVATLDGLNSHGQPYDFDDPLSHGIADYLTSKPLKLDYKASDSIYLSFYYEPQGNGNYPEEEDSLVLEFLSYDRQWHYVWSKEGFDSIVFQQVLIPILDSIYLHDGFQFIFKNYATLSGALDHWHIDYVHLDSARTKNDTDITDVTFIEGAPSMLSEFEAMPWEHFLADSSMKDSTFILAGNYTADIKNTNYSFQIYEDEVNIYNYAGYSSNFDPQSTFDFFGVTDTFMFYSANTDSALFEIRHVLKTDANDLIKLNDTVRHIQKFYNYYAYDDGTAEVAYGLNTQYALLAYQFHNKQKDTLRGVQMYFAPVMDDVSEKELMLTIWKDNNGLPGDAFYQQQTTLNPVYLEFRNNFYYYLLDTLLVIDTGKFYVGWEQLSEDMLNIGFDRNADTHEKIYYNLLGVWKQSVQNGSLMMRPMFGDTVTVTSSSIKEMKKEASDKIFRFYPNPANDLVKIIPLSDDYHLQLFDVSGKLIKTYAESPTQISTASIQKGMYFLQFVDNNSHQIQLQKLIISR